MLLKPKMAINYRSSEEHELLIKLAEQQGINVRFLKNQKDRGRAYICPQKYHGYDGIMIETFPDPDTRCSADNHDPFKWNYVEASVLLRNLLIAERRKNAT